MLPKNIKRYTNYKFKKYFRCNSTDYIIRRRVDQASHRLRVQDHPGTAGSLAEKRKKSVSAAHGASAG